MENIELNARCEQLLGVQSKYDGWSNNYNQITPTYHKFQDGYLKLQFNPCDTHIKRVEIIHK